MRPEDVTSARRIQQEILDKYPAMQKAAMPEEEVFSNEELEFEGDGHVVEPYETSASNFVKNLETRLKDDEELSFAGPKKEALTPQNLKAYLDQNVTNKELRAEIDGYIQEIEAVDDPAKYLDMFGANDVKDMILQVYVKEELRKAEDELTTLWATDATVNFTTKLENLRTGKYKDADGVIQSRDYDTYPRTPYQAAAMQVFNDEIIPSEMETTLRRSLVKLEQEGYLKDITNEDLVLQAAIQQKTLENRQANEDMVDKEYEAYVRKRSGLAGLTKRHESVEARREELKSITKEEVQEALSSRAFKAIEGYLENNKNEDGTYDISALSELIEYRVGKDFLLSRSKDTESQELHNLSREIRALEGVDVATFDKRPENITKELAKFCGFGVEGRDHTPRLWKAAKQTGEAIAVGGAVHCISPNVRKIILNNEVIANLNIHVDTGSVVGLDTTQLIEVFQNIEVTIPMCFNLLQSLGTSAVAGLVISVLEDLIFGNDIEFEKTCFNTNDYDMNNSRYTNIDEYEKYLKEQHPEQYNRIKFLLDKARKEAQDNPRTDGKGNWYHEEFFNFLRQVAGLGSNLNCAEIAGAKMYTKPEPLPPREVNIARAEKHWEINVEDTVEEVEVSEDDPEEQVIFNKRARSSGWSHLVKNIYNCSPDGKSLVDVYGLKKAIYILKIAQAITDGNYSRERMEELYNLAIKGASKLKNVPGVDYGTYYSVLMGNFPSSVKLPRVLCYEVDDAGRPVAGTGIERCEISDDEHELVAPPATNTQNAPAPAKGPAVGKRTQQVVRQGEHWQGDLYFFKDENGQVHEYESREERDQAVREAEERTGRTVKDSTYEEMTGEKPEEEE